jgi:hypothetical protein
VNPVKLRDLSLAVLFVIACPAAPRADTVYYAKPGGNGILTVTGKIVQETGALVQIETETGTVSIPRGDVLKVIRDTATRGRPPAAPPESPTATSATATDSTMTRDTTIESPTSYDSLGESQNMRDALAETGHSRVDPGPPGRVYHYGFKGGMNVSNLSVDPQDLEEGDSLRSYALGGWLGVPLNRRLAVQAEALYSVKGDSETVGGYTTSTRLAYIDVPVVARVGFLHDAAAQPSLFLGPLLAVNVSASSKLEGDGVDTEVDVKDDVRAFELGLVMGGGVDFAVGRRTVGVELRYSKGLSNIAGDGANGTARNDVLAILGSIGLN